MEGPISVLLLTKSVLPRMAENMAMVGIRNYRFEPEEVTRPIQGAQREPK